MEFLNYDIKLEDGAAISIEHKSKSLDFYHYGLFSGLEYDVVKRQITMKWTYEGSKEEDKPHVISLFFIEVHQLEITSRDCAMPHNEDGILQSIVFVDPSIELDIKAYHENSRLTIQPPFDRIVPNRDVVFCFCGGQMIRIGAGTTYLSMGQ